VVKNQRKAKKKEVSYGNKSTARNRNRIQRKGENKNDKKKEVKTIEIKEDKKY